MKLNLDASRELVTVSLQTRIFIFLHWHPNYSISHSVNGHTNQLIFLILFILLQSISSDLFVFLLILVLV